MKEVKYLKLNFRYMDFCFTQSVGNTRFNFKIYDSLENRSNDGLAPVVYYFLEMGSFCIGLPAAIPSGLMLSLEVEDAPRTASYSSTAIISPAMMLQLVEIMEAIRRGREMLELETMALALYSSSLEAIREKKHREAINFREAHEVHSIVQEWKKSPSRIEGTFQHFRPPGISRHRFLNLISRLYNCSAAQLIYDINMQKAMNLLLTSGHSIIVVSELSGYTSKENFITAFRNTYGVTPGYLRKRFR